MDSLHHHLDSDGKFSGHLFFVANTFGFADWGRQGRMEHVKDLFCVDWKSMEILAYWLTHALAGRSSGKKNGPLCAQMGEG